MTDLVTRQNLRQALAAAGPAELGCRITLDQLFAAQVAVEGAQAGDLALQRRGRHGPPSVPAVGQLGHERGQLGVPDGERIEPAPGEKLSVLKEIRAVRVERVAGETTFELEVAEEVEDEVGEVGGPSRAVAHTVHLRHQGAWSCPAGRRGNGAGSGGRRGLVERRGAEQLVELRT